MSKNESSILNKINSLIDSQDSAVIHFGCYNNNSVVLKKMATNHNITKYIGVDVNDEPTRGLKKSMSFFNQCTFLQNDMQTIIEECIENEFFYDFTIIDGIFDKNVYGIEQPNFVDTSIRNCLAITNTSVIIIFDTKNTEYSDFYSIEFLIAYIQSMYSSFTISRTDKNTYILIINKYY